MNRIHRTALLVALLVAACATFSTPWSRDSGPRLPVEEDPSLADLGTSNDDGVVLWCAGVDVWLVDPKDRRLLQALRLLDARLGEVPADVGDPDLPVDALRLPLRLLLGPTSLRFDWSAEDPLADPKSVQLGLHGADDATAEEIARRFEDLLERLAERGMPLGDSELDERGLRRISGASPPMARGTLGEAFVVSVGEPFDPPLGLGSLGLPEGVQPALACRADLERLPALFDGMARDSGKTGLPGFLGELDLEGLAATWAVGIDEERTWSVATLRGYERLLASTIGVPSARVGPETLAMVPEDAVWAMLGANDLNGLLSWILELVRAAAAEVPELGGADPVELLAAFSGVHLERDLEGAFGERWGVYVSDTTGGSGPTSLIGFFELADADRARAVAGAWIEFLNGLGTSLAKGWVDLRSWEHEGQEFGTLTFPGLPVPLEITWTLTDRWAIKGLSRQGVIAAWERTRAEDRGLLANASLRAATGGGFEDLVGLAFLDSPRLLRDGYGVSTALGSALANAVRSRSDAARDVGPIVPSYQELASGARASVVRYRLVGGDLVAIGESDRSQLVHLTGAAGLAARFRSLVALPAVAALVAVPQQLEHARREAQEAREQALEAERRAQELEERDD